MNDQRTTQRTPGDDTQRVLVSFNPAEWHALQNLREHYHPGHDFFTKAELAHLRFVCWLYKADGQVARLHS